MAAPNQPQPGQFPTVYISFSAEINAHTTESLIAIFANEINQGKRDFYLMLSTPGGSVMNGLNVLDLVNNPAASGKCRVNSPSLPEHAPDPLAR